MLKSSTHLLTSKQPAKLHHLHAAAVGATGLGDDVNASERSCDARAPGCRGGVHAFICNRTAFFGFAYSVSLSSWQIPFFLIHDCDQFTFMGKDDVAACASK